METGRGSQLPSKRGSILGKGGLAAITNRPSRFNVEEHERLIVGMAKYSKHFGI